MAGKPPVCLTIAGLDPSGGAGIVADVNTFAAFGCRAAAAVTAVTFQNTRGVFGVEYQTVDSVGRQINALVDDHEIAAVKTGMLPTREIVEVVAEIIVSRQLKNIVVDPVLRSTSGFELMDQEALTAMVEVLFPCVDLLTPNVPEAEVISGIRISSIEEIGRAADIIRKKNVRNVLVKGGHFVGDRARDHLFTDSGMQVFEADRIVTCDVHGTGCMLSSAIAANLGLGKPLVDSVAAAKTFITEKIRAAATG